MTRPPALYGLLLWVAAWVIGSVLSRAVRRWRLARDVRTPAGALAPMPPQPFETETRDGSWAA